MLLEEKKEGGWPSETPNPLMAMASSSSASVPVPMPFKIEMPQDQQPQQQRPAAALPVAEPVISSSALPRNKMPAGVPNPILMNSSVPFETSPLHVPMMVDDPLNSNNATTSSVPSPLASPMLSTDPPSRQTSNSTTNSTMEAMASAINNGPEEPLDIHIADNENYEPPTARRRRVNTIHWATSSSSSLVNNSTTDPENETLQPVNFGEDNQNQVTFSPGSGTHRHRKLSNASSIGSASASAPPLNNNMGLRTQSSGSLYSEYSCDSTSVAGSGIGSGAPVHPMVATSSSGIAVGGVGGATVATAQTAPVGVGAGGTTRIVDKRQKRLERNRESARASRRRRKQYLEELEVKVSSLSEEMDRGRFHHACMAVRTVRGMRMGRLRDMERTLLIKEGKLVAASTTPGTGIVGVPVTAPRLAGGAVVPPSRPLGGGVATVKSYGIRPPIKSGIQHSVTSIPNTATPIHIRRPIPPPSSVAVAAATSNLTLEQQTNSLSAAGPISRTSDDLQIVQTFMKQQLLSLVQPTSNKFLLWLSLQKDGFYRGGRSASERLSAARIGERLLHGGTYRAAPNDGMWPLLCHEVGLSYDQEDRIRQTQRQVLANSQTWVHRHTALSTQNVIESVHTVLGGAQQAAKRREHTLMSILTPEQRVKFLAWASRKQNVLKKMADAKIAASGNGSGSREEYQTSPDRHVAANLYIIDHQLSKVKQLLPHAPSLVHQSRFKKLSRRPDFESLAGLQNESDGKLSRVDSTGSIKRSLDDMAIRENPNDPSGMLNPSQNNITPESAQSAGQGAVMEALKDVMPIIPKSALHYSQNPHYVAYPPQPMLSSQPAAVPSAQPFHQPQLQFSVAKSKTQVRRVAKPKQSTVPARNIAVPFPDPLLDTLVDDIPMPTPVSVLLSTADDFIAPQVPVHQQQQESWSAGFTIPEPVPSITTDYTATAAGRLSTNHQHQSAPDFSYPSLLSAPMAMIPEISLNPPLREGDIVDFALQDLPEMEADDWAIGEGFDMDM